MCVRNRDRKPDAERRAHARNAGAGVFASVVAIFTLRPGHPRLRQPRDWSPSVAGSPYHISPTHFSFRIPLNEISYTFTSL